MKTIRLKYKELYYELLDNMSDKEVHEYGDQIKNREDKNAYDEIKRLTVYHYFRKRGTTDKLVALVNNTDEKRKCKYCKTTFGVRNPQNYPIKDKNYCTICGHNKYREKCREARKIALGIK